ASARNHGVQLATGEWLAFLDADDAWKPAKIELQIRAAAANPDAVLIYTGVTIVLPNGEEKPLQITDPNQLWPTLRYHNCVTGSASAVMMRREVFLAEGG